MEIEGVKACGEKKEAEILFLGREEIDTLLVKGETLGKILIGGKFGKAALMKALTLEAAVVTTEIDDQTFEEFSKGQEWVIGKDSSYKLPLLVIDKKDLSKLESANGKKATLDPKTLKLTI